MIDNTPADLAIGITERYEKSTMFGRSKNMVRRRFRPDGRFHRDRRRSGLAQPLTLGIGGTPRRGGLWAWLRRMLGR